MSKQDFKKLTKAQLVELVEANDEHFEKAAFRLSHVFMDIYNAVELGVVSTFKDADEREYFALPKDVIEYVKNVSKTCSSEFAAAIGGHIEFNVAEGVADESET